MNVPLKFNFTVNDIKDIEKEIIKNNEEWLKKVKLDKDLTPEDFLKSYLYKDNKFDYIHQIIIFLKYVSPYKDIRDASSNYELKLKKYFMNFYESSENYQLFLILKKLKFKKNDINNTRKLVKNILKEFEYNGVQFTINKKKEFNKINTKLLNYENQFTENIYNDIKKIRFKKDELKNIENNILFNHKVKNSYIFDTTYPDHSIIMSQCSNDDTRKKMNHLFNNIALENLFILKNIVNLRRERAIIFGFKNTIDYYLKDNRLASKNDIQKLLNKLIPILKKKSIKEYNELKKISNKKLLYDYDLSFYSNIYKSKYLNLDEKIVKNYFPSNYSIPQILKVYANLFGIKIILIKGKTEQYYAKNVDLYKVIDNKNNELLGYIYLDLYPRIGKYNHAATFDIQNTYINDFGKRIIPVTAIVCNFSLPDKGKNYSLLMFGEIVTFCHELGHALNNVLSKVKYAELSGVSTEDDFSEMPSQFFENWCYNENFLKEITLNYKNNKKMPQSLIYNIKKNKDYNNGIHYLTQILYLKYDLDIHAKKKVTEKYLYKHWFNICKNLFPFKVVKNNHPMCRFGHLIGYEVGYYGYLWSIIYSYNAFSLFEKYGIFNKKLGVRFKKTILEKGGTVKGTKMLENFLKSKKTNKYFFKIF
jgi:Zn-dependent oligopeptidase